MTEPMSRVAIEIARLEAQIQDLRDHLQAIGPEHPLHAPFTEELRVIESKVKDVKKLL